MRVDAGKEDFDKCWGYEALESIKEHTMQTTNLPFAYGKSDVYLFL